MRSPTFQRFHMLTTLTSRGGPTPILASSLQNVTRAPPWTSVRRVRAACRDGAPNAQGSHAGPAPQHRVPVGSEPFNKVLLSEMLDAVFLLIERRTTLGTTPSTARAARAPLLARGDAADAGALSEAAAVGRNDRALPT